MQALDCVQRQGVYILFLKPTLNYFCALWYGYLIFSASMFIGYYSWTSGLKLLQSHVFSVIHCLR